MTYDRTQFEIIMKVQNSKDVEFLSDVERDARKRQKELHTIATKKRKDSLWRRLKTLRAGDTVYVGAHLLGGSFLRGDKLTFVCYERGRIVLAKGRKQFWVDKSAAWFHKLTEDKPCAPPTKSQHEASASIGRALSA